MRKKKKRRKEESINKMQDCCDSRNCVNAQILLSLKKTFVGSLSRCDVFYWTQANAVLIFLEMCAFWSDKNAFLSLLSILKK